LSKRIRSGKWLLLSVATALGLTAVILAIHYHRERLTIESRHITLQADGAEHEAFRIRLPAARLPLWLCPDQAVTADTSEKPRLRLLRDANDPSLWRGLVKAPVTPGASHLYLHWRQRSLSVPITFVLDPSDSYSDGTPDFLRLHTAQDRQAFRSWFTSIAQAQADLPAANLPAEIHDCAALLRYAYREALHAHDANWLSMHVVAFPRPSVRQYTYPQTPLGANLFRVRPGPFSPADLDDGSFAQFADAQTLMLDNTYLLGRDPRQARSGDLIFYRQLEQDSPYDVPGAAQNPSRYHSPFHSMILCEDGNGDWVVYHTGPIHNGKGEMRRLTMSDLLHHPDARWRPLNENANFLGVYRWNILREGE
jgi:uncharacterized protein